MRSDKKSSFLDPDSIPDSNYSTFSLLNSSRNINFQTAIYKVNLIPFVVLDYSSLTALVTMPMTFSFGYLPAIILLPGCPEDALTRRKKGSLAHCLLHLIASHHVLERSRAFIKIKTLNYSGERTLLSWKRDVTSPLP